MGNFVDKLRTATPDELIAKYKDKSYFSDDGIPVIVAARNEEDSIAHALASLAENNHIDDTPVRPIVVENGSSDRTANIARQMGATVLHSEAFKLAALQLGVSMLDAEGLLGKPVLFTDADSIVSPTWVRTMAEATQCNEGDTPIFAGGRSVLDHGPSHLSDAVGNFALRFEDTVRRLGKNAPAARGDNTALNFAGDRELIDWYLKQDKRRMVYEDDAIGKEFIARGARFVRVLGRDATVSSLGDRYASVRERLRVLGPGADEWLFRKYEKEYPGIVFGKYGK